MIFALQLLLYTEHFSHILVSKWISVPVNNEPLKWLEVKKLLLPGIKSTFCTIPSTLQPYSGSKLQLQWITHSNLNGQSVVSLSECPGGGCAPSLDGEERTKWKNSSFSFSCGSNRRGVSGSAAACWVRYTDTQTEICATHSGEFSPQSPGGTGAWGDVRAQEEQI